MQATSICTCFRTLVFNNSGSTILRPRRAIHALFRALLSLRAKSSCISCIEGRGREPGYMATVCICTWACTLLECLFRCCAYVLFSVITCTLCAVIISRSSTILLVLYACYVIAILVPIGKDSTSVTFHSRTNELASGRHAFCTGCTHAKYIHIYYRLMIHI